MPFRVVLRDDVGGQAGRPRAVSKPVELNAVIPRLVSKLTRPPEGSRMKIPSPNPAGRFKELNMLMTNESSVAQRHQREVSRVVGLCGICPGGCGVKIELRDGQIERLTPLKGHPAGIVCPRGAKAKEIVYSPDRLRHPLARVGAKGEGRFERISWDAALDSIAERPL